MNDDLFRGQRVTIQQATLFGEAGSVGVIHSLSPAEVSVTLEVNSSTVVVPRAQVKPVGGTTLERVSEGIASDIVKLTKAKLPPGRLKDQIQLVIMDLIS